MANVTSSLRTKLLSVSAISALVGSRMYPDVLLQNATLPSIVIRKISTRREHYIEDCTRLAHSRFEVRCYATSRTAADGIADAVRTSGICSYRGTTSDIYFCGTEIDSGDENEDESPTDGNQVHRYITSFDLMVHYKEAT